MLDTRVKEILQECESRIKKVTNDDSISIMIFSKRKQPKLSFDDIIEFVCKVTGESKLDVMKVSRKRELVTNRQLIIYFSYNYCRLSKSEIGRRLDQDHTTIMAALKKVNNFLKNGDEIICTYVTEVNNIIYSLTINHDRPPTT